METRLEEGDIVMCTVEKVVGTTVFVKIDENGEGTIITSEIAPGRIRNLRDYVVPNKKIVCKILKIGKSGGIYLSLRRVKTKERKEVMEKHKREKNLIAMLRTVSKNYESIIEKIKKKENLVDFFEGAKSNPKVLEKLMSKEEIEKLMKILTEKKEKEISVKREFKLSSELGDGLKKLKKVLPLEAVYIAAGNFSITIKNNNYKEANQKINSLIQDIEKKAKQEHLVFEMKK